MYSLLPPEDFLPFVVPFQGGGGVLAGVGGCWPRCGWVLAWVWLVAGLGVGARVYASLWGKEVTCQCVCICV